MSVPAPFNSAHSVLIGSNVWHYLRARPNSNPKGTVLLLHGFPDLPLGWKHQVPLFTSLGYQVIAPQMLGYGQTSSPSEVDAFSYKNQSNDLAALLDQIVPDEQVILGGHDWGGALVWPFATYHPHLFKAVFSVGFPYIPPTTEYVDLRDKIAANTSTTFEFMLQLGEPSTDQRLQSKEQIRQFLLAAFGAQTPDGKFAFSTSGFDFDAMPHLQQPSLISDAELDYYVSEYHRNGFRGPLNSYRIARINFENELPIAQAGGHKFAMPVLFIQALQDAALTPELSKGMDQHFDKLTRAEVNTGHWAQYQGPEEVNDALRSWITTLD
ncbi:hypothetical protein M426DRAFT_323782 [Hypoxylon sp. CI-4A]|nr:hypothetical protein M426DRAFT_323782 [Hypoxylon sp. CI-4A]